MPTPPWAAVGAFRSAPWAAWCAERWPIPFAVAAAYLAFVAVGARWLVICGCGGRALSLQRPLVLWNVLLTAFSFAGLAAMAPGFLADIAALGPAELLCPASGVAGAHFAAGARGLAMLLFMLSKLPELVDTFFLVARGRPVSFLHAFHHASVMIYCWLAYGKSSNSGLLFATMNYLVHSLMYLYFTLQAAGLKPTWGAHVTRLQIAQMVAGVLIVASSAWLQLARGRTCEDPAVLAGAAFIYSVQVGGAVPSAVSSPTSYLDKRPCGPRAPRPAPPQLLDSLCSVLREAARIRKAAQRVMQAKGASARQLPSFVRPFFLPFPTYLTFVTSLDFANVERPSFSHAPPPAQLERARGSPPPLTYATLTVSSLSAAGTTQALIVRRDWLRVRIARPCGSLAMRSLSKRR